MNGLNSQETTPILPLPEDGSDWSDQEDDFDMQDRAASPMQAMPRRPMPDRPVAPLPDRPGRPIPDRPGRPDRPVPPIPDRPGRPDRPVPPLPDRPRTPPFPTDRDGLTGPFLPDLFLPDPFLPGPFRLYAPTGPGTGVQSCPASFFRSPLPASDSTMHLSGDRFRST